MAVAENKYSLALVQTQTEKKIRPQPWYKERLHTKYVKALKPSDTSQHLSGRDWIFVKDGLDDFRDGLPPAVEDSDFIKSDKGPGPTITGSSASTKHSVKEPAQRNRFTKHQICFSRITPLQQQRREHIDEIEYGLLQHPLALYPHLEESVPPEMFEDIVDILDPEMNLMEEEEDQIPEEAEAEQQAAAAEEVHPASARSMADSVKSEKEEGTGPRNPYRWLPRKEEKEKEKRDRRSLRERAASSPSEEEHIQKVTREFCQWVADLGGESNNIEESTITSLFASGYETKPALSVPIHVVELTNVPPELRMSASVAQQQPSQGPTNAAHPGAGKAVPQADQLKQEWKVSGDYQPSWVKFKYGAWYLPPKTWQKRDWTDPLVDPKELKDQEMSDAKKKSHKLNQELSSMHASKAFMDFISKKNVRKPEFLEEVGEIQRKAAEEGQRRLEAELLAKQKKSTNRKGSVKV